MNIDKLAYLDLAFLDPIHRIIHTENSNHSCYFRQFNHQLHSENKQLNSLVDLQITLAKNLELQEKKNLNLWESSINHLKNKNKIIKELIENQDFIKRQNQEILKELKQLEKYKELRIQQKEQLREYTLKINKEIYKRSAELQESYKQIQELLETIKKIVSG